MVAVLIKQSLHITTKLKYGNRIQYLGHSSLLLRNLRLCSILPTIQTKVALMLKNECFLITYITDYPILSFPSVSKLSIAAWTAYGIPFKIFFTFCAIPKTQCIRARRCKAWVREFITQVSTWWHETKLGTACYNVAGTKGGGRHNMLSDVIAWTVIYTSME